MWKLIPLVTLGLQLSLVNVSIATYPLIELKSNKISYSGKVLARSSNRCWLLDRAGQICDVDLKSVQSFRRLSPRFRSYSPAEVRSRLLKEFGSDFEVTGTRHYLVCAARGHAQKYANLLEETYRTFYLYFRTRGFEFQEPEFPLVALAFPDRNRFEDYCRSDHVIATRGLMGYYLRTSNRVAFYDPSSRSHAARVTPAMQPVPFGPRAVQDSADYATVGHAVCQSVQSSKTIDASLRDTIIHEAMHQFAFNIDLHSRIGDNPKWVVEGLATVLEVPGIRNKINNRSIASRINRDRFIWFQNYVKTRRPEESLATFLRSDGMFNSAVLDAYSQAWALSFYLIETRPRRYIEYLKAIASRDSLRRYSGKERLEDFKNTFGSNLAFLEADFLRFFSKLDSVRAERK